MSRSEPAVPGYEVHLAPYVDRFAGVANKQRVDFVESTWRRWLHHDGIPHDAVDIAFSAIGEATVSRPELRDLSQRADTNDERLGLLIATLVWGRGKRNARMRDPILRTLTHPDRDRVLGRTADLARDGAVADAYEQWTLPGLGPAFFSKWLWAISSPVPEKCSLVLDARVWATLRTIGWDSRSAAGSTKWPLRYAAYVKACHGCAAALGPKVSAEDVEYALFRAAGDLNAL
jgi:hypothetical protein